MTWNNDKTNESLILDENTPVPDLLEILQTGNDDDCRLTAQILRRIGELALEDPLANLTAESHAVRSGAAWILGMIQHEAAVPALMNALYDDNSNVRVSAAWALEQIGDTQAAPELVKQLTHDDQAVRQAAAQALIQTGDSASVPALIRALLIDEHWGVRECAAEALGAINDPAAIKALEDALSDEDARVRKTVAKSLRKLES